MLVQLVLGGETGVALGTDKRALGRGVGHHVLEEKNNINVKNLLLNVKLSVKTQKLLINDKSH